MPVSFEFRESYVKFTALGHYKFDDWTKAISDAVVAEEFSPGTNAMVDVRESMETRTSDELKTLASLIGQPGTFGPRCAVCVEKPLHFGLGRMLSVFGESYGQEYDVFIDFSRAEGWLSKSSGDIGDGAL